MFVLILHCGLLRGSLKGNLDVKVILTKSIQMKYTNTIVLKALASGPWQRQGLLYKHICYSLID